MRLLLAFPTTLGLLLTLAAPGGAQECERRARETRLTYDLLVGRVVVRTRPCDEPRWTPTPSTAPRTTPPAPTPAEAGRGPRAWRETSQPAVPRAWRDALSPCAFQEAHGQLRAAVDAPRAQLQALGQLARRVTLTVDQAIGLVATIRASHDRLVALTLLHPAITDRAAFGRTYPLLAPEDAELLHYRVTRVTDGCRHDARLARLQAEERELLELLGPPAAR